MLPTTLLPTKTLPTKTLPLNRTTINFQSRGGGQYLYDDITGSLFPWNPVEDALLNRELGAEPTDAEEQVLQSAPAAEIQSKTRFIRKWRTVYGAFSRPITPNYSVPTEEQIKDLVWEGATILVLQITEACNLACKYCCFGSGAYKYVRKPSSLKMTPEEAIKAVDWFMEGTAAKLRRNPRKRFGLSLYGGEPTSNMPVIDRVAEHVHRKYPGLFKIILTTNGTLLTPENVKILMERQVFIAISIDGPEEEHDRLRVDHSDRGTHKHVMKNLAYIRENYPKDFARMFCVSVYDPKSDIVKISTFFKDYEDLLPPAGFVNMVAPLNTTYFDQFTPEDSELFDKRLSQLKEEYMAAKVKGERQSSYNQSLAGVPIMLPSLRTRLNDQKPYVPYTSTCLPGYRIAVSVGGKLDLCERVNRTNPVGHLDDGGYDYSRARELIKEYQETVMRHCSACSVARGCSLCFCFCEADGGFALIADWCRDMRESTRKNLSDYITMLEAKPELERTFMVEGLVAGADRIIIQS